MPKTTVFVEDRIREKRVQVTLDVDRPTAALIEGLVGEFGLPRRDFDLSRIEYWLVRAIDGTYFSGWTTFRHAGIAEGELLYLVSPEGRRVWRAVQMILDEIESETIDKVKGKLKDKVVEEVWDRVTGKLAEIEKTQTGGNRVERLREWVDDVGGPTQLVEIIEDGAKVTGPVTGGARHLLRWGMTVVAVGGTLLISRIIIPPTPQTSVVEVTRMIERPVEVTRIVEHPVEVTRIVERSVEVTRIVEHPVEVTRIVERPVEVTRIVEQPVEVTRIIERPVEVTREVEVPRVVILYVPTKCAFCDNFTRPELYVATWPTGDTLNPTGNQTITNGKYRWELMAREGFYLSAIPNNMSDSITDFYLTVEAQRVSGPVESIYGLVFRRVDRDNFYYLRISDSQWFGLWVLENDRWERIVSLQNIDAIRPGGVNRLTVSAKGSHFVFLVNGQYIYEASDSRLKAGGAGLAAELINAGDQAVFEFDNFELRVP